MPAFVPAAARTLLLFEAFARERRELSNAEIAKLLELPETSCVDLLHTLQQAGYLMRTARSRRFYPTPKLSALAAAIASNNPLATAGREAVEMLGDLTGESALCGVLGDHHVEVLGIREGRHALRFITTAGTRIGLHATALGHALLSELEPAEAAEHLTRRPLKALTPHTITDLAALQRTLAATRQRGHAWVDGDGAEGVAAMAVAGRIGDQPLGLSITGPTDRMRKCRGDYEAALAKVKAQVFGTGGVAASARRTGAAAKAVRKTAGTTTRKTTR
ncbi:MAG: IclR family transcriptional regulator [Rubrivivax sp.]